MREIQVTLDFKPTPWKRPAGRNIRYDSQVADKSAFSALMLMALNKAYPAQMADRFGLPLFTLQTKVYVEMIFEMDVKEITAVSVGDLDNFVKFTLDALQSELLTGVIWADDRQVCVLKAAKQCANGNRTKIRIGVVEA